MQKNCKQCKAEFEITEQDLGFYKTIGVPEPILCPQCRQQKRYAYRNERGLYRSVCSFCKKSMLSMYDSKKNYVALCNSCYFGDKWNALDYAQEFDFGRSFFEQFYELQQKVPKLNLQAKNCVNSDYINIGMENKNCYLLFGSGMNEDCLYSTQLYECKNCVDCFYTDHSEMCYEVVDCVRCYKTAFSVLSQNCDNSYFLFDCKRCSDCVGCFNLRDKKYHIFNKPVSKAEYEAFKNEKLYNLFLEKDKTIKKVLSGAVHKYMISENSENVTGNFIYNSKNAESCFNIAGCEDVNHLTWCFETKNSGDSMGTSFGELYYECTNSDKCFNSRFCMNCLMATDCCYCDSCNSCKNLFGCVGVQHKDYCIMNKRYSKEEYVNLKNKIIDHMKSNGEWGEFFPCKFSSFAYNETVAGEYFPLTKEDVEKNSWNWRESDNTDHYDATGYKIPDNIKEVKNDICEQILFCEKSEKPYKIISQELKFYREMELPVPRLSPHQRHLNRMKLRNPRKLFNRKCDKCSGNIKTTYSPDRSEKIYCEKCYLEEVY